MKLFGWFRNDPESKGLVPGRAVAIPHYPRIEIRSSSVENNSSADSISTLSVTLRLLQSGESAREVGSKYERLPPGIHQTTNVPEGCQRLHCNCPNWVHLLVRQEGYVYKEHTEVPVWVNPQTGKMDRIDKDKLIQELEPERERARRIFDDAGMLGSPRDAIPTPSAEPVGNIGGVLEEMFGQIGLTQETASVSKTSDDSFAPDMSQHPPIEGVEFQKWVAIGVALIKQQIAPAAYDQFAQSQGVPAGKWAEIDRAWKERITFDWKLGALYGSEYERLMKS